MKPIPETIPAVSYSYEELTDRQRRLVDAARNAVGGSYAPFSNFHVGAAIEIEQPDGSFLIISGANQENAALGSTMCAERTAAYWAHANYPDGQFRAIAIAARDAEGKELSTPISPCGSCRQALVEYEKLAGSPVEVWLVGAGSIIWVPSVKALLPFAFTEF